MKPVPYAVAQLAAIRETAICEYTLTVCTPLLCEGPKVNTDGTPAASTNVVAPLTGAAGAFAVLFLAG